MTDNSGTIIGGLVSPKRYSVLDIIVLVGGLLGIMGTFLAAYNSYNAKFRDLDIQIYDLKSEVSLLKSRTTFAEDTIKQIIASEDRANIDTRNRFDIILGRIGELKDEITKGIYNASPGGSQRRK